MPQAVWTGDLSFGLVSIPVKLYRATAPKQVQFHQYEAGSGRRIRYARVASGPPAEPIPDETRPHLPPAEAPAEPMTEEVSSRPSPERAPAERWSRPADLETSRPPEEVEVPWEEIVKGYEIEPGRVVTVTRDELESVAPERSRVLEVEEFIELREIDPVYFEKSYYVVPQSGGGAERPYWLLYRAMEESAKVAVGRFVMRTKEYLAAVRPAEHVLMLETLFYADEVRDPKEVWLPLIDEPPERELRMAHDLIEALTGTWDPARRRDEQRERLLELLHGKAGEAIVQPEPVEEAATSPAIDLIEELKASIEAAKQARDARRKQTG